MGAGTRDGKRTICSSLVIPNWGMTHAKNKDLFPSPLVPAPLVPLFPPLCAPHPFGTDREAERYAQPHHLSSHPLTNPSLSTGSTPALFAPLTPLAQMAQEPSTQDGLRPTLSSRTRGAREWCALPPPGLHAPPCPACPPFATTQERLWGPVPLQDRVHAHPPHTMQLTQGGVRTTGPRASGALAQGGLAQRGSTQGDRVERER